MAHKLADFFSLHEPEAMAEQLEHLNETALLYGGYEGLGTETCEAIYFAQQLAKILRMPLEEPAHVMN